MTCLLRETYASQVLADLARWDSLNAEEEMSVSRAFAHAKDRSGPGMGGVGIPGTGDSLESVANSAWRFVDSSQRFN